MERLEGNVGTKSDQGKMRRKSTIYKTDGHNVQKKRKREKIRKENKYRKDS